MRTAPEDEAVTGRVGMREILIGVFDACIVIFSSLFSLGLRFNFGKVPEMYLNPALFCLPVDIIIAVVVLRIFRLYNRVWTYASMEEGIAIAKATACIEMVYVLYRVFFQVAMPRSFYIFDVV